LLDPTEIGLGSGGKIASTPTAREILAPAFQGLVDRDHVLDPLIRWVTETFAIELVSHADFELWDGTQHVELGDSDLVETVDRYRMP
jgi:hypothetical protein